MESSSLWTRRAAIKATAATASAIFAAPLLATAGEKPSSPAPTEVPAAPSPNQLLLGVSDIHIHAAPDSKARSVNELELARAARDAGMRALMFKSNHFSCHDRAWLVTQALEAIPPAPGAAPSAASFACFGSLCMNKAHGDKVNVHAAEQAVNTTGKLCRCIWMPTQDAAYQHKTEKRPGKGIAVVDPSGRVLPEVVRVMEICAEADIIFATGHCSPKESLIMARKAKAVGLGKFVVTHANSLIWKMTRDEILRAVDAGAYVEYCYLNCLWGGDSAMPDFPRMPQREFLDFVRIAPERTLLTTDLGQFNMPHPMEGMRQCILTLQAGGVPPADIARMTRHTPEYLLGLSQAVKKEA